MSEPRRGQLTALILAGQREGRVDAFAAEMGQTYKCLVPVAGEPMILHVVRSLAACEEVGDILISANAAASLEDLPPIAALIAAGGLQILPAKPNLVDSVMAALAGRRFPVLVTTADNVLLSPHAVAELHDRAQVAEADIAVAFARPNRCWPRIPTDRGASIALPTMPIRTATAIGWAARERCGRLRCFVTAGSSPSIRGGSCRRSGCST